MFNKFFTIQKLTQTLFTGSLIIILLIFVVTGAFLYSKFYKIILQTEEIIIIQPQSLVEPVKIELLDKILKNLAVKTEPSSFNAANVNNPFE